MRIESFEVLPTKITTEQYDIVGVFSRLQYFNNVFSGDFVSFTCQTHIQRILDEFFIRVLSKLVISCSDSMFLCTWILAWSEFRSLLATWSS